MRLSAAFIVLTFALGPFAQAASDVPAKPTKHDTFPLEGWQVHVDKRLLEGAGLPVGEKALPLLIERLKQIKKVVPADKVARLQKVPIWIDLTYDKLERARCRPSAQWLKEQGYDTQMAKCVHIPDAAVWCGDNHQRIQPWSVLHELAHAYHDQVLGFDNPTIEQAWKQFCDSGKYKSVDYSGGGKKQHYGLTNAKEFFAEMSESLFGRNDFYPFDREELKHAEPEIYRTMCDLWGVQP